ncbi:bifunctional NAD(P)/FAD-dependent oxidoreductase/class I SAM-dependent methyltransferase [Janibacter limosus]|uniref:bifunctional NAD(P)/FAD-dependent oxidoreductase/class I SAM-dependent methyltransferase n=1 Tax=Janibacter limosus TaxID=53458 RepID=UPI0035E29F07|nr:bifunctional NAD(P)/FAD-dependent oxidoreductase/class I SAM-dependent methyltransferase [Janibacter limosus]
MSTHHHSTPSVIERHVDVAVVGGSAAGLAATLQLSRQRRSVIVIDSGEPRNAPADQMHSYLGHEGRSPAEFLQIAREEVRSYGAEILTGRADAVTREESGFRIELSGGHVVRARRVIAATGLTDELPDLPGLAQHWGGAVIHCPFCHGYEARDQRIVSLVTSPMGLHPIPLLRQLTDDLTVLVHEGVPADEPQLQLLRDAGVRVVVARAERVLSDESGALSGVALADGAVIAADTILVGTRLHARVAPFAGVGLVASDHPSGVATYVEADPMTGATAVPGLYAAGSIAEPMLRVLPTAAAGSRVGSMLSFDPAHEDLQAAARPNAHAADWDGRYSGDLQWSGNPNGSLVAEVAGPAPGSALDVGAGEGGDAVWLAQQGWQVTASDISAPALERVGAAARDRGLEVALLQVDANASDPFGGVQYDPVTAAYASFPRTPDGRGAANVLDAVAPGGRLVVINHDTRDMDAAVDRADVEQTRPFDHKAFVTTEELVAAIAERPGWTVAVNDRRERPAGAASPQHVHDIVLHARRSA